MELLYKLLFSVPLPVNMSPVLDELLLVQRTQSNIITSQPVRNYPYVQKQLLNTSITEHNVNLRVIQVRQRMVSTNALKWFKLNNSRLDSWVVQSYLVNVAWITKYKDCIPPAPPISDRYHIIL